MVCILRAASGASADRRAPPRAGAITAFFGDDANRRLLGEFKQLGLWPVRATAAAAPDGPLKGLSVLFTGTLSMPRSQAQKLAEAAGATLAGSVNKKLDLLIAGDDPGSKLDKAEKLGIEVLTEADFIARIGGAKA